MSIETLVKKIEKRFDRSLCVPGYFHFYQDGNVAASLRCNPRTGYWNAFLDGERVTGGKGVLDPEEGLKMLLDAIEGEEEFKRFEKLGESLSIHHYD